MTKWAKLAEENQLLKDEILQLKEILDKKKNTYNNFYSIYNKGMEENKELQWELLKANQRVEALFYSLQLMQSSNAEMQKTLRKDYEFKDGKWIKKNDVALAT